MRPHRQQPAGSRPWDSPGKRTGVGGRCLLLLVGQVTPNTDCPETACRGDHRWLTFIIHTSFLSRLGNQTFILTGRASDYAWKRSQWRDNQQSCPPGLMSGRPWGVRGGGEGEACSVWVFCCCPLAPSCLTVCDPAGCSPPRLLQVSKVQGRETFSLTADSLMYTLGAPSMVSVTLCRFSHHPPSPPLCSPRQDKELGSSWALEGIRSRVWTQTFWLQSQNSILSSKIIRKRNQRMFWLSGRRNSSKDRRLLRQSV